MVVPQHPAELVVSPIPRLKTGRLLLREPRVADFDAFAVDGADELAGRFVGGAITDRVTAWRRFVSAAGGWVLQGAGWWGVEELSSGVVIGWVGVFRREVPTLEIGWRIYRPHWGNGYAPEAAAAALTHTKDRLAGERIIAQIAKGNTASIRVAEKIGMQCEGEIDFQGELDWLYVR